MSLFVGLGGATHNACVAVRTRTQFVGACEQERVTRVRAAGVKPSGVPDEALALVLQRAGYEVDETTVFAAAEPAYPVSPMKPVQLDHHFAHACSAFLPSPYDEATIVVCDRELPEVSVWDGAGSTVRRVDWPWHDVGFARLYSECSQTLGFGGHDQRMEALCRVVPASVDDRFEPLFAFESDRLRRASNWKSLVEGWAGPGEHRSKAGIASALQKRIGDLLIEFLTAVRRQEWARPKLCIGGSLFLNSCFNARVKNSVLFDDVFVPINPDNAGLSIGTSLHVSGPVRQSVSPFLGPSFSAQEIKATLDNCKLTYNWASEADRLAMTVRALQNGQLVAWFEGPMEWGPRALGGRSILANPFAPYVLENLNLFLKHREPWRGYALSGLDEAVHDHFDGPSYSPYMECDYVPRDKKQFRHILPGLDAAVRVQTVGAGAAPLFRELLRAFGQASGIPLLVNTSFNGFGEPIVCSPRDAIRVFFGTGLDVLILGEFVVMK